MSEIKFHNCSGEIAMNRAGALGERTQAGTGAGFNADAGSDLIGLKIGLHAGACLAVTLNDWLDYFGQTVNIAARVQALAGPDEIIVTDDVQALLS